MCFRSSMNSISVAQEIFRVLDPQTSLIAMSTEICDWIRPTFWPSLIRSIALGLGCLGKRPLIRLGI